MYTQRRLERNLHVTESRNCYPQKSECFVDFFPLAQNIYRLHYRDRVQKLHCPIHGNRDGPRKRSRLGTAWPRPHQGIFTAEESWAYPHVLRENSAAPVEVLQLLPSGCFTLIRCSVAHDLWAVLSDLWSVWLAEKARSGTWLLCKQGWHIISREHRKDKITQIVEILSSTVLLMWMSKIRIRVVRICVQVGFLNSIFLLHCLDHPVSNAGLFSMIHNSEFGHQKFGCKTIPWVSTN